MNSDTVATSNLESPHQNEDDSSTTSGNTAEVPSPELAATPLNLWDNANIKEYKVKGRYLPPPTFRTSINAVKGWYAFTKEEQQTKLQEWHALSAREKFDEGREVPGKRMTLHISNPTERRNANPTERRNADNASVEEEQSNGTRSSRRNQGLDPAAPAPCITPPILDNTAAAYNNSHVHGIHGNDLSGAGRLRASKYTKKRKTGDEPKSIQQKNDAPTLRQRHKVEQEVARLMMMTTNPGEVDLNSSTVFFHMNNVKETKATGGFNDGKGVTDDDYCVRIIASDKRALRKALYALLAAFKDKVEDRSDYYEKVGFNQEKVDIKFRYDENDNNTKDHEYLLKQLMQDIDEKKKEREGRMNPSVGTSVQWDNI